MSAEPRLLTGHSIEGRAYPFPHLCPGQGCAVYRWLSQQRLAEVAEQGQDKSGG